VQVGLLPVFLSLRSVPIVFPTGAGLREAAAVATQAGLVSHAPASAAAREQRRLSLPDYWEECGAIVR